MSASLVGKIQDIEAELARTQINKATMSHICQLKAKLAKYKRDLLTPASGQGGGAGEGFDVRSTGDARVGFVGFPSVGKSTLLTSLTDVASEAASYEFTTLTCIPGIKFWKGAKIQLLDLPGIIEGANDGKGRGRQVIAVARTCSCLIIVLDAMKSLTQKKIIEKVGSSMLGCRTKRRRVPGSARSRGRAHAKRAGADRRPVCRSLRASGFD